MAIQIILLFFCQYIAEMIEKADETECKVKLRNRGSFTKIIWTKKMLK